jgi:hypothetical protein
MNALEIVPSGMVLGGYVCIGEESVSRKQKKPDDPKAARFG